MVRRQAGHLTWDKARHRHMQWIAGPGEKSSSAEVTDSLSAALLTEQIATSYLLTFSEFGFLCYISPLIKDTR